MPHHTLQLFPPTGQQRELNGLYLNLQLQQQATTSGVLIYANYIASIDGRISLRDQESNEFIVPANLANQRDWRLYQELAAQADIMLTSARYFRQLAKGKAQDLLPMGKDHTYHDLAEWRAHIGLSAQADVAIISNSLDIPSQALAQLHDRRVLVFTSEQADQHKINRLTKQGIEVISCGQYQVEGVLLKEQLIAHNYRSAYMIAGPEVHCTLIKAQVLDRLFLTTRLNVLGSDAFHTILGGNLKQTVELELQSLYLDQAPATPQLFAQYHLKYQPKREH